jgi:DNA modification methylase
VGVKPYYEANGVTIYNGDCREIIPSLDKVDMLVTDPPYFLPVQSYVGVRGSGYRKRMLGDVSVLSGYFESLFDTIEQTVAAGGTYYVFCDAKSYPIFWRALFPACNHVRLCIWDKVVSYNGYTWRHQHELILWGETEGAARIPTGDGDILRCRGVLQKDRTHPAEKPVELLRQLIAKHEGATSVLDPFCGSGASILAAKSLGKRAIGIEIEEQYCETAARRLEEVQPELEPAA